MPILSLPTVWSTDQILTAAALNGEFTAVANIVNALDYANVGAAGFYASNIIPTSGGQAQFGGKQAYTFPAGVIIDGSLSASTASFSTASFTGAVTMNSTLGVSSYVEANGFQVSGAYVPPLYLGATGTPAGATAHMAIGAGITGGNGSFEVTLSGSDPFTSASSYYVFYSIQSTGTGLTAPLTVTVVYVSGTQFSIVVSNASGTADVGASVSWLAIGT
jgi:hypothetical protein